MMSVIFASHITDLTLLPKTSLVKLNFFKELSIKCFIEQLHLRSF